MPLAALLGAVLDTNVSHPRAIGCLAAVISHWNGRGYDELLPLEKAERDRVVSRLQQWAIEAASHPSRRRCELYQVACAIKRIGGPDFAQSMDILLRAELALLEQQREEGRRRKELGLRRDPGSEQTTCYGPIYRQAFEALDGAATRDVLLSWLEDPSFGVEAARALKKYGASGPTGSGTELVGRPKFEQVQIARERRVEGDFPSESAVAHRVLNRAAFLVASEDAEEQKAAIEFASAAAQMDYGRRNETFIQVLNLPGSISAKFGLLRQLLFAGEPLRANWIEAGAKEVIAKLSSPRDHNDNWWQVRQWLELLAFTERPLAILSYLDALPEHLKPRRHEVRELVYAVGFTEKHGALGVLMGLTERYPSVLGEHEWAQALARIGMIEAARYLTSRIFAPEAGAQLQGIAYYVVQQLGALLRLHPDAKAELLDRLSEPHTSVARHLVAGALKHFITPSDASAVFALVRVGENDPIDAGLLSAVESLGLEHIPIAGSKAYELEPTDLSGWRKLLFQEVRTQGQKAQLAKTLLDMIDRKRDEYGHPLEETRHPDISSGQPWPPYAAPPWAAVVFQEPRGAAGASSSKRCPP